MFLIADCFPLLEELDLSQRGRLTNIVGGVEALSSALFKLRRVNLSGHEYINDELLFHLFKNCKLLEDAIVFRCPQLTQAGMSSALIERPTLRSLSFTRYYEVYEHAVLFEFIRNCPSLNAIKVEYQCGRVQIVRNPNRVNFVLNPQLKSLSLVSNRWLTNENMEAFASSFPNLELLDLSSSHNMYEEGVCQVLRRCCKIRHLNLSYCPRVKLRNMNFEVLELEVLNLSHTRVDDKGLRVISKSCCGLLQLLLESCFEVTEKGLKHVVENCKQLREINLKNCRGVQGDIVASMVSSRPSLRKIIAPPCYSFTDKKWEYFSLCMIIA
ncbi:F-box protein At3g58530 [Medicago truncatula]|nr:F-box protein At3g58530 [Medicago truncatula]